MFIDVHCHLEMCENLDLIIEKCRENGVEKVLTQGTNKETNRKALELAEKYDIVEACLGLYPLDSLKMGDLELEEEIEFIRKNKKKIRAIGEIGVDYKEIENKDDLERERNVFIKFVELALEIDKPVIVHSRKAEIDTIDILERLKAKKVIMHCFSGKMKEVKRIAENGWYLSIPGNVTFSEHFQNVVKNIDLKNLLCETDSPFLHPVKGERDNDPSNVTFSYKKISEIKKIELKEVEKSIENNYKKVFS